VKQVPALAVLNFDFVVSFAVPFRFQNVTRRVTVFDCFQYRPRQLANRNVFVRPARGYGYNESGQQSQATGYVHRQQCYLGPGTPHKPLRWHSLSTTTPRSGSEPIARFKQRRSCKESVQTGIRYISPPTPVNVDRSSGKFVHQLSMAVLDAIRPNSRRMRPAEIVRPNVWLWRLKRYIAITDLIAYTKLAY
jgi:hypothetical protein